MFTTWTSANRIVSRPLTTTFTRDLVPVATRDATGAVLNWNTSYWLYTRIRRKKYKYVGMDKATAVSCAMAMNLLYNRFVPSTWKFDSSHSRWESYAINSSTGAGRMYWKFQTCGVATIIKESHDSRYSVEVDVDEELPYRYACIPVGGTGPQWADLNLLIWSEFEANPDIVTPRFATGKITGNDFTYDEEN